MKLAAFALVTSLLGGMSSAWSAPAQSGHECDGVTNQRDMTECYGNQAQKADTELDATYAKLFEKLKGLKSQAILRDAEHAWVNYRREECAFEAVATEGGTVQSTMGSICFAAMTRERIKLLNYQMSCPEGDLTCADRAPAIWDGEWTHGTELLIAVTNNAAVNFYWHGEYQDVKASEMADDGKNLSFDWSGGKVMLTLTGESSAVAAIREHGQPDQSLTLSR